MSAIGGIICLNRTVPDPDTLLAMSRSMIMRGRDRRGAYFHGGIGLFQNCLASEDPFASHQPLTKILDGKYYSVLLDGRIDGIAEPSLSCPLADSAELALEAYFNFGSTCVSALRGSFALAICDEFRGEVFLARDRLGSRPLYYMLDGDRLVFASEIKALLRAVHGTVCVDISRLRAHIFAPCGSYAGEDLYREIRSLPPGHCGVYSRLGISVFPYEQLPLASSQIPAKAPLATPFVCPDEKSLRRILTDTLFAFDYPQFDDLMPGFLQALSNLSPEQKAYAQPIAVEDASLWTNTAYARERADRLGERFGVSVLCVPPNANDWITPKKGIKRLDRLLANLLDDVDDGLLQRLFGVNFREQIECEKNLAKRIRMQGLLYQTVLWAEHYPIRFV